MGDTDGDWTRRHARLADECGAAPRGDEDGDADGRVVRADPPADDWRSRHAWCRQN